MRSAEQKAAERGTCTVHRLDDKIRLGLRHEALNRRVVLLREELLVGRLKLVKSTFQLVAVLAALQPVEQPAPSSLLRSKLSVELSSQLCSKLCSKLCS